MKSLRRRLELLLVLTLFFPVMLSALYKGDIEAFSNTVLNYGIPIAVLILSWVMLEATKKELHKWTKSIVKITLLVNIAAFAPLFVFFSQFEIMESLLVLVIFRALFWILMLGPVIIFITIFASIFWEIEEGSHKK